MDVIDICLPTPTHVEIATAALATGKHVMCEKPLAPHGADAREDRRRRGAGQGLVHAGDVHAVLAGVGVAQAGGGRGAATAGSCRRSSGASASTPAGWFRNGQLSGGALLDLHVHDTDFVYHLFGKPRHVFSRGHVGKSGEIDHVVTQYLYAATPARASVTAEGSWTAAEGFGFRMQYTVHFERATADFDLARKDGAAARLRRRQDRSRSKCPSATATSARWPTSSSA